MRIYITLHNLYVPKKLFEFAEQVLTPGSPRCLTVCFPVKKQAMPAHKFYD